MQAESDARFQLPRDCGIQTKDRGMKSNGSSEMSGLRSSPRMGDERLFMAILIDMTNEMIFLLTNDHLLGEDFPSRRKAFYLTAGSGIRLR
jgi:hypothetical protein